MADIRHKRNGVLINGPRNFDDLEIRKNFLNRKEEATINISSLLFAGEDAIGIRKRALDGLSGGVGLYEGDPYQIEVGDIGDPTFVFDGYLDYADEMEFIGCNEVKVSLKKRQGNDWLNEVGDSFSFRYLQEVQIITSSDFVKVPYVINYVPDNMQLIVLSISLFMMSKELITAVKETAEAIGDVVDAATPVIGVGVGFGAVAVTAADLGNFILVTIKLIAYIAYTIAIVIAIKNLIQEIIEQLIPKKRFHLGMRLHTLFEKACNHLGLEFKSELLNDRYDWVIIPSKGHKGGLPPEGFEGDWVETGVPDANSGMDTFGDLIRVWKDALNADYKIENGVFEFERRDYWQTVGNFVIEDFFTDQKELKDKRTPNSSEIIANYNINWAYDTQDQNTLDNQQGRIFQATTTPNVVKDQSLVNLKGLDERAILCSLGLRKDSLTKVESVLRDLAKFVDTVTGFIGGGTNYASKIDERKGSLHLSSHFTTIPKMVVMSGDKLAKNQRDLLDAKRLWEELHFINSFVEVNGEHNQYWRYLKVKVPFCMKDFISLVDNHYCKTKEGDVAMIESLIWKVWQNYATIDYRVKEKHSTNFKLTITP